LISDDVTLKGFYFIIHFSQDTLSQYLGLMRRNGKLIELIYISSLSYGEVISQNWESMYSRFLDDVSDAGIINMCLKNACIIHMEEQLLSLINKKVFIDFN
jgi:hypothetical protein